MAAAKLFQQFDLIPKAPSTTKEGIAFIESVMAGFGQREISRKHLPFARRYMESAARMCDRGRTKAAYDELEAAIRQLREMQAELQPRKTVRKRSKKINGYIDPQVLRMIALNPKHVSA
jgi:hypothetical protein